ncbi:MAG: hypothetical protein IPJ81_17250 [Chitinophagaceae bacterium]|nr:hypothetical protein [Chitinophagaceae bacterium]
MNNTWPVYYYKKVKYYYIAFIPAILAVFAPSVLINIDKILFKKYEWLFEKAPMVAMGIFMAGLVAMLIVNTKNEKVI